MICPDCQSGVITRKRPDAVGRVYEVCDSCQRKVIVTAPRSVAPLLTPASPRVPSHEKQVAAFVQSSEPRVAQVPTLTLTPVVGKPCPCCHQKVRKLPLCVRCKERPRILGLRLCSECNLPPELEPRFCVVCGVKYAPRLGEGRQSAIKCPKHRDPVKK